MNSIIATTSQAVCKFNGEIIPCDQVFGGIKSFFGWGIGFFGLVIALGIIAFVFWIMMLVHAIKNPIEHKAVWILILLITGIIGAIVYYFAIKKHTK